MPKKVFLPTVLFISILACLSVFGLQAFANSNPEKILFHAELPLPNEYSLFAGGGWDGNWYVGKNHIWIKELKPLDTKGYERLYLGARLGRSKTYQQIKEHFKEEGEEDISSGPYSILIGISDSKEKKPTPFLLTEIDNIPFEGDSSVPLPHAGGSRWFWKEVPMEILSKNTGNYLWLWSDDEELNSRATSPILAAGIGSDEADRSFLLDSEGEKSIRYFEPALAIKLASSSQKELGVKILNFKQHPYRPDTITVSNSVKGHNVLYIQPQIKTSGEWTNVGMPISQPPYDNILGISSLPFGKYYYRNFVEDWSGLRAFSDERSFVIEEEGLRILK
ncbi:MAG: hypothetical protein GX817_07505 [Elusimicrobia bacterium]|nr:hypothetical protein [Elusimicrobiota bacterium]